MFNRVVATFLLLAPTAPQEPGAVFTANKFDAMDRYLWDQSYAYNVRATPWVNNPYDAAHELMIPLHAAFLLNDSALQREFADMFRRMLASGPDWGKASTLDRLQFTYFVGRFAALASQTGHRDVVPDGLVSWLRKEFGAWWTERTVLRTNGPPFSGERDRLRWILTPGPNNPSYLKLFYDQDWYVLALAADLRTINRLAKVTQPDPALTEAQELADSTFRQFSQLTADGGLVLQPGVWRDYPDYAYSGHSAKGADLPRKPGATGSWDSSHSMRLAAILLSLATSEAPGSTGRQHYINLIGRLRTQLEKYVFVPPSPAFPAWRLNNYMDGTNGLYRWHKTQQGSFEGDGPYELSSSLTLGWWSLLGGSWIEKVYLDQMKVIPYSKEIAAFYDPSSVATRGKSELSDRHSSFSRERELIVRLAAKVAASPLLLTSAP